jgi:hypothetical protein
LGGEAYDDETAVHVELEPIDPMDEEIERAPTDTGVRESLAYFGRDKGGGGSRPSRSDDGYACLPRRSMTI